MEHPDFLPDHRRSAEFYYCTARRRDSVQKGLRKEGDGTDSTSATLRS